MPFQRSTVAAIVALLGFSAAGQHVPHATAAFPASIAPIPGQTAKTLQITVLSTMLAGNNGAGDVGEWGFAALVEVDGRRFLFDTGTKPETVLENARQLRIDLSDVTDVIVSHSHGDHTGGLLTLRRELLKKNPRAMSTVHLAANAFQRRVTPRGVDFNQILAVKDSFEATGGVFIIHAGPIALAPGVWLTGPVPRPNLERNFDTSLRLQTATGFVTDSVPEDMSLVVETEKGLIVLTGCGHAGIINIVEHARKIVTPAPIHAVVGGLHTFAANDSTLQWTGDKLWGYGIAHLLGAHCTGIEAVYRLRQIARLDRKTAVVSAVGSSFSLATGIDARALAR